MDHPRKMPRSTTFRGPGDYLPGVPRFKEQAVCIRHLDWSETSQVVVLLTENLGKVRGLAKGSKRMSPSSIAKFSGGIELLTRGQICGVTRPGSTSGGGQLATLTEWDLQNDHHHLRRSLPPQRVAMFAAETCDLVLADEDPHPGVFNALTALLASLDETDPWAAVLSYQWALLSDTGFQPQLKEDVRTNEPLKAARAYSFDPVNGGLTTQENLADWRVRAETVKLLQQLADGQNIADASTESIKRAGKLLATYTQHLAGKRLNTISALWPK